MNNILNEQDRENSREEILTSAPHLSSLHRSVPSGQNSNNNSDDDLQGAQREKRIGDLPMNLGW